MHQGWSEASGQVEELFSISVYVKYELELIFQFWIDPFCILQFLPVHKMHPSFIQMFVLKVVIVFWASFEYNHNHKSCVGKTSSCKLKTKTWWSLQEVIIDVCQSNFCQDQLNFYLVYSSATTTALYGGVFQVYFCTARPPGQRATGDLGNYRMFNEVKTIIVATQHCTLLNIVSSSDKYSNYKGSSCYIHTYSRTFWYRFYILCPQY